MKKKQIKSVAKKVEDYYAQFPDWYWKYGLHDAVILSVSELQLIPDYKEKEIRYNCLKIDLDSRNAVYERDIKSISFFNYKIEPSDFDINSIVQQWWMNDTFKISEMKRNLIEIETATATDERAFFIIKFEFAETERTHNS